MKATEDGCYICPKNLPPNLRASFDAIRQSVKLKKESRKFYDGKHMMFIGNYLIDVIISTCRKVTCNLRGA